MNRSVQSHLSRRLVRRLYRDLLAYLVAQSVYWENGRRQLRPLTWAVAGRQKDPITSLLATGPGTPSLDGQGPNRRATSQIPLPAERSNLPTGRTRAASKFGDLGFRLASLLFVWRRHASVLAQRGRFCRVPLSRRGLPKGGAAQGG